MDDTEPNVVGVVRVVRAAAEDPWGCGGIALRDGESAADDPSIVAVWASPAHGVAIGRGASPSRPPDPTTTLDASLPVTLELTLTGRRCVGRYSTDGTTWHRIAPSLTVPDSFRPTLVPFTATSSGTVRIEPLSLSHQRPTGGSMTTTLG
ncbi:hypothetical protein NDI85_15020 [Halomicroarcula sp. S1AR25-4]|uniref:hypothetical protein n=1 Tax=Haloarcula sp. S1AR25-4 TaxID=2950538 RepID=UPI0028745849|nr:hypothetical protein [Halomicroarcula sp. S1AR25-4]MDS0279110.1 hypothetical protein [Halomicroarcula sp. S1AR25-4]